MSGPLKTMLCAAALASLLLFASIPAAVADRNSTEGKRGIDNFLTENTLVYPGREGEENLIHFGRFGNFDWYFPCQFESGDWTMEEDQVLSLTYHNSDFEARRFKLERRDGAIALIEPDSDTTIVATLRDGNHIPYF